MSIRDRKSINFLVSNGYLAIRFNSGVIKTEKTFFKAYVITNNDKSSGLPDIIAFKDNKFLMFEVKESNGTLRNSQKDFNDYVLRYGIKPYTVTSWVDVLEILKEIERS